MVLGSSLPETAGADNRPPLQPSQASSPVKPTQPSTDGTDRRVQRSTGSGTDRGGGGHRRTRVKALPRIYNNFHGCKEAPFSLTPDPRFLPFSDKHCETLNQMAFGINEGKGFI